MRFPNLETTSHTSEEKPGGWVELQYHRARGHGAWICPASATAPSRQWSRFSTRCHGVSNTQRRLQRRHLLQKSELNSLWFIMIHYSFVPPFSLHYLSTYLRSRTVQIYIGHRAELNLQSIFGGFILFVPPRHRATSPRLMPLSRRRCMTQFRIFLMLASH